MVGFKSTVMVRGEGHMNDTHALGSKVNRIMRPNRPDAVAESAPAPRPAHVTYHGGPLLTAVEVFTIFCGAAWKKDGTQIKQINDFFSYILSSPLIDQLAEYSSGNKKIGHGKFIGTATITPSLGAVIDDTAIVQILKKAVADRAVPAPTLNTLYFIYMPSGVMITKPKKFPSQMEGPAPSQKETSCKDFCGYHHHSPYLSAGPQLLYSVIPAVCPDCSLSTSDFDSITCISSHELCEAITDPFESGWFDDATLAEIGDICAWRTKKVGPYVVQTEWSNRGRLAAAATESAGPPPSPGGRCL
jgi:hypothetical protein